jgi:hypothetical protein
MKRWALGALVVLALLAGGLFWLSTSLDFVVKTAIERFAPAILGVAVEVREVSLSAADGRGVLRGIEVGNPPGYSAPRALRAGKVSVALDPATLADDVVTIREIVVQSPEIAYEVKGGTNNLEAIRRNIEAHVRRSGGQAADEGADKPRSKGRRYVIGRIVLRDAKVTMTGPLLKGGGLTFALPDIQLRDVGRRSGGVTAAEAAAQVAAALVARIAQAVLTNAEALRRGGVQGAIDALRGLLPR